MRATDRAGNTGSASVTFTVSVTLESLINLTRRFVTRAKPEKSLVSTLKAIGRAGDDPDRKALPATLDDRKNNCRADQFTAEKRSHAAEFVHRRGHGVSGRV